MNTQYIARTEHHSGITRYHLNPDYVPPRKSNWLLSARELATTSAGAGKPRKDKENECQA